MTCVYLHLHKTSYNFIYPIIMVRWLASFSLAERLSKYLLKKHGSIRKLSSRPDELVFSEVINNKGLLTLNKPKALNSLNSVMVDTISKRLTEWEDKLQCVIVRGSGEKAFCAGGDVVAVTSGSPSDCAAGIDFFRKEYTTNYKIGTYKIPYLAIVDGITMGGGVGLSVHGKYRIATERTMFAMPETAIGLFPDVGASYFLSRLEGKLGLYLALTGHRLKGKDVVKIGFGTHFVDSKDIPKLLEAILNSTDIENVLKEYSQEISQHVFSLSPFMNTINEAFSAPTVEEIIVRLKKDGSDFSKETLNLLNKMSPISLKISKLELEKGANMKLKECLQMEFGLAQSCLKATSSADFYEGVRALLKDKDKNPKWNPAKLEDVTDDMVNKVFHLPPEDRLKI